MGTPEIKRQGGSRETGRRGGKARRPSTSCSRPCARKRNRPDSPRPDLLSQSREQAYRPAGWVTQGRPASPRGMQYDGVQPEDTYGDDCQNMPAVHKKPKESLSTNQGETCPGPHRSEAQGCGPATTPSCQRAPGHAGRGGAWASFHLVPLLCPVTLGPHYFCNCLKKNKKQESKIF